MANWNLLCANRCCFSALFVIFCVSGFKGGKPQPLEGSKRGNPLVTLRDNDHEHLNDQHLPENSPRLHVDVTNQDVDFEDFFQPQHDLFMADSSKTEHDKDLLYLSQDAAEPLSVSEEEDFLFASNSSKRSQFNYTWPIRDWVSEIHGQITLGALHMVHERSEENVCGKIMPQGGIQALENMLYTMDYVNGEGRWEDRGRRIMPDGIRLGVLAKDDCDRDIFGLEQAVDFIKVPSPLSPCEWAMA
ncbi:hypothetical protein ACOMHN_011759 [Nucella lapillus]